MGMRKGLFSKKMLIVLSLLALWGIWAVSSGAYETQSNNENRVRVDVVPLQIIPGSPVKFKVNLNTHSVNLAYDMTSVSLLRDDLGREYVPVNWQGSPPGGHHRRGILEFPHLEGEPTKVTLVIRGVADVDERTFEWDIQ